MTTWRLIILRLYNLTLGHWPRASFWLKKLMVHYLIKKAADRYVASSRYFDFRQFSKDSQKVI